MTVPWSKGTLNAPLEKTSHWTSKFNSAFVLQTEQAIYCLWCVAHKINKVNLVLKGT